MQPAGFVGAQVAVVENGNDEWGGLDSLAGDHVAALHGAGAFLEQTAGPLVPGEAYTVRFLTAVRPNAGTRTDEHLLVLKVDTVEIWQSSAINSSDFQEVSATFTARRSTATITLENDSPQTSADILLDELRVDRCHDCPSSVAFGAADFIESCSMTSDLYITFLGDAQDRSWSAQTELLTFTLRTCVEARSTVVFEGNRLTLEGDVTGTSCPLEYQDKAYVDEAEWNPGETFSFALGEFYVPTVCARIDSEFTSAAGDGTIDLVSPSEANGWQGELSITNNIGSPSVFEVTVALACGRAARNVVLHGQPSVLPTGIRFNGAGDYVTIQAWDYARDATFTVSCKFHGPTSSRLSKSCYT